MNKNIMNEFIDELAERFADKFYNRYEKFLKKFNDNQQVIKKTKAKRYARVKEIPTLYPSFTASSMRWLIFNEETNNFSKCIKRVGRKVLIDLDNFEKWIDKNNEGTTKF